MAQLPQIDSLRRPNAAASAASKPRRFPWLHLPLAIVVTLLVGYGLIIVYSAVRADGDYQYSRQLGGVAVGLVFMILVWRFDYRRLSDYTTLFLIINVVLIMSPHIPGLGTDAGMGARSWIKLGMQIQPGEFAKITVILMDAAVMARYGGNLDDPREYVKALGIMMVPFACIMTQPDLGTGLVYLCIAAFALVMGGANSKCLLITLGLFVAAVVAVFAIDEVSNPPRASTSCSSNISATACSCSWTSPARQLPMKATTCSRRRSLSARAACSARACSRARNIR